jgi:hypothetical protein
MGKGEGEKTEREDTLDGDEPHQSTHNLARRLLSDVYFFDVQGIGPLMAATSLDKAHADV